jgi:hypothetical protein
MTKGSNAAKVVADVKLRIAAHRRDPLPES